MIRHLNRELSGIKYQRDSVCGYLPIAGSKCFDISLLRNLNSHSTLCVSYIFCHKESVKGFQLLNLLQIVISQVHTYLFPHQLDHQHFPLKWRFVQLDVDWINPRLVSFPTHRLLLKVLLLLQYFSDLGLSILFVCCVHHCLCLFQTDLVFTSNQNNTLWKINHDLRHCTLFGWCW